jgi:hypothetical protein
MIVGFAGVLMLPFYAHYPPRSTVFCLYLQPLLTGMRLGTTWHPGNRGRPTFEEVCVDLPNHFTEGDLYIYIKLHLEAFFRSSN